MSIEMAHRWPSLLRFFVCAVLCLLAHCLHYNPGFKAFENTHSNIKDLNDLLDVVDVAHDASVAPTETAPTETAQKAKALSPDEKKSAKGYRQIFKKTHMSEKFSHLERVDHSKISEETEKQLERIQFTIAKVIVESLKNAGTLEEVVHRDAKSSQITHDGKTLKSRKRRRKQSNDSSSCTSIAFTSTDASGCTVSDAEEQDI
jgi:hypothetical protein